MRDWSDDAFAAYLAAMIDGEGPEKFCVVVSVKQSVLHFPCAHHHPFSGAISAGNY